MRSTALAGPLVGAVALLTLTACSSGLRGLPAEPAAGRRRRLHLLGRARRPARRGRRPRRDRHDAQEPAHERLGPADDRAALRRPAPTALTPTSQLLTVDGVDWLPEQLTAGYLFTTVGRQVNVEVAVPDAYTPEADVLVDLSPVIAKLDPVTP